MGSFRLTFRVLWRDWRRWLKSCRGASAARGRLRKCRPAPALGRTAPCITSKQAAVCTSVQHGTNLENQRRQREVQQPPVHHAAREQLAQEQKVACCHIASGRPRHHGQGEQPPRARHEPAQTVTKTRCMKLQRAPRTRWRRRRRRSRRARCQSLELGRDLGASETSCAAKASCRSGTHVTRCTVGKELGARDSSGAAPHAQVRRLQLQRQQAVEF